MEVLAIDPIEEAEVELASKSERKGKTGYTPSQLAYLGTKLRRARVALLKIADFEAANPDEDLPPFRGYTINVPGAGSVTVFRHDQAKNLYQALIGSMDDSAAGPDPKKFYGRSGRYVYGEYNGETFSGTDGMIILGEVDGYEAIKAGNWHAPQNIAELFEKAEGDASQLLTPAFTGEGRHVLWLKDAAGTFTQVSRAAADQIYRRGFEIVAPTVEKQPLRIVNAEGITRGLVAQMNLTEEPEQTLPYRQPRPKAEKPPKPVRKAKAIKAPATSTKPDPMRAIREQLARTPAPEPVAKVNTAPKPAPVRRASGSRQTIVAYGHKRTGKEVHLFDSARTMILAGQTIAEVTKALGCHHGLPMRILKKELALRGLPYASTARIPQEVTHA